MKLERYIFHQLFTAMLFAAGGMLFIAVPGLAVGAVHRLAGVETATILRYLPMATAKFVPYVLPIAFLLALVSTYGRLAQDNEWTAIRMAGINPYRMLFPAMVMGVLVSGIIYFMNAEALPRIAYMQKVFRVEALRSVIKNLAPGRTELQHGNFYLFAPYREGDVFYDALIELPPDDDEGSATLTADTVEFDFTDTHMTAELHGLEVVRGRFSGDQAYARLSIRLDRLVETREHDFSSARFLDTTSLIRALRGELTPGRRRSFVQEFHMRGANSLTGVVFVLLGVATGLLMRKGTQLAALAVSVGYAMVYWILSLRLGKEMVRAGTLDPWVGSWGPLAVCAIVGLLLTRKAFRQ